MDVIYRSYIPPILADTKEFNALDITVDKNLNNLWDKLDAVFGNQFIESCDEDGISYFEGLLGIIPAETDTLEFRRALVLAKWNDTLPYNYNTLLLKLNSICGEGNYEVYPDFNNYKIGFVIHSVSNIEQVEKMLREVIPCNIFMELNNELEKILPGRLYCGGAITKVKEIYLSTVDSSQQTIGTVVSYGSVVARNKHINIGG